MATRLTTSGVSEFCDLVKGRVVAAQDLLLALPARADTLAYSISPSEFKQLFDELKVIEGACNDYPKAFPRLTYTNEAWARINYVDKRDPR